MPGVTAHRRIGLHPHTLQSGSSRPSRSSRRYSRRPSVTRLAVCIATVGYCGYFPVAPGTIGSLAGLAVYAVVRWPNSPIVEVVAIGGIFAAGVWAGTVAERYFGGIDPGPIVIDEVVGMLMTLAFIPVGWPAALAGFFLFRIFDIVKPYP